LDLHVPYDKVERRQLRALLVAEPVMGGVIHPRYSWDEFNDTQSGVAFYQYQILKYLRGTMNSTDFLTYNVTQLMNVGLNTSGTRTGLSLEVGSAYLVNGDPVARAG
jgi:hypothetical protein